jgi:RNA polymerase sigma-70 factor, ECF subfamily
MNELSNLEGNIPALRRYAWTLVRDESEADDLVQECLVRALDRLHTCASPSDLRPWLFTIMHNLHCNRWRRARRHLRLNARLPKIDEGQRPPQTISLEMKDVIRGLSTLPEEQQHVLLLVAVEGFEYAEAARILDIPVGTVMSRLSRARDRLRGFVEGQERPKLRRVV